MGPTWHLQSWLVGCNGLATYGHFRAWGLSDTTWMHWYRVVQAAIGEELHYYIWQNNAGFWMLWFDSSSWWCYAMPSTSCSFLHIRSWRRPSAKSNKSKISGISEQELTWADCACSRSRNSPVSNRHIVLKNKAYNLTQYAFKDSNLFQSCFRSTALCWASHIARTSFACLQMSSELVQSWPDLSKETCEEQEVEMDIIWNKENFMAARRPPHTTTSSEAIYLSPCQLCNQQRLFNLDASEKLAWDRRQVFPFS